MEIGEVSGGGLGVWISDSKWNGKHVPFTSPFTRALTYTHRLTLMMESFSDRPYFLVLSPWGLP